MENKKMLYHRWAQLRFSVIGGLLSSPPKKGETKEALEALAAKSWLHPATGDPVQFGFSTIEEWYYRARKSDNPIDVLTTPSRVDIGNDRSFSLLLLEALKRQYELHPGWTYELHHKNIEVVANHDVEKYGDVPSYSTTLRRMKARGWTKKKRPKRPTPGQKLAYERLEKREVRSYERSHVGALGHLDFHQASRSVIGKNGDWFTPVCFATLDDHSRLCLHAQWYTVENTDNLVHGFGQALLKRGLIRELMSDRGSAMMSEEFTNGLLDLSIIHSPTLPYSPYQNGKQENFWATLEGQLMSMLEHAEDLTLEQLNVYTQAWIEQGYNHHFHEEIKCTPVERFMSSPSVLRPSEDMQTLQMAFSKRVNRKQRKSDGTITLDGVRFEIPNHLRTLDNITIRYRGWDLSSATIVDKRSNAELAKIRPIDKEKNANCIRRTLSEPGQASYPKEIKDSERVAPLLEQMLADYSATGLPPAYIPKNENTQNQKENSDVTK